MGGHCGSACTSSLIDLLCSPYSHVFSSPALWTMCSILLTEMSSESPGFMKSWPRCLNLNVAKTVQSQRICEAIFGAHLHLSHSGLFTSPSLSRCPFKWQNSVNNPLIMHSRCLLKLSNSLALIVKGLVRKPLMCLCEWTASTPHVSYLSSPWSLLWKPLHLGCIKLTVYISLQPTTSSELPGVTSCCVDSYTCHAYKCVYWTWIQIGYMLGYSECPHSVSVNC
jgi:hypothetical protein